MSLFAFEAGLLDPALMRYPAAATLEYQIPVCNLLEPSEIKTAVINVYLRRKNAHISQVSLLENDWKKSVSHCPDSS